MKRGHCPFTPSNAPSEAGLKTIHPTKIEHALGLNIPSPEPTSTPPAYREPLIASALTFGKRGWPTEVIERPLLLHRSLVARSLITTPRPRESFTMADHLADDSLTEDIWASPTADKPVRSQSVERPRTPKTPKTPKTPTRAASPTYDHEAALRKELEGVKNVNRAIEGVIGTLERAQANMGTVSGTVSNASALLNTWTRILSQTEHNQRLVLNPSWKGSTQDILDIEAEAIQKQQAAERRALEVERRREEAKRRAEEEERRRQAGTTAAPRATRGLRSRGRGGRYCTI
ncbi:unnamed protein product [Parascedosporium putredinis]|uniref:DASH complex subunit DUO1 n=1 Tax=Parascedosporium putredinis TaxID=1442378 RepID=A0A9P1HCK6_9PEZI|nr:unnamed protein product [Parascedosporium putredinis]CAI8004539.1 unnamed protein product [Parascedosporium putredinis]